MKPDRSDLAILWEIRRDGWTTSWPLVEKEDFSGSGCLRRISVPFDDIRQWAMHREHLAPVLPLLAPWVKEFDCRSA